MQAGRKLRIQLAVQNGVFVTLFLALVGLLGYGARQYHAQWDFTQNGRNSLAQASIDTLKQLKGPVTITAYASAGQDPRLGDVRKLISDFLAPYRRQKPDLALKFIDPTEQPKLTRAAGIQLNGEMVVEFGGKSEHLTTLNEQDFANLLMRLARNGEKLVMYLDGHGERKLDGSANHDLGEFGKQLAMKGFKTGSLNLALAQEVPANAAILVIAAPQVDLLKGEVEKIEAYLDKGGNLLWLIDQEPLHGLQPIAEKLGLILSPGIVIDPAAQQLRAPPTWALGATYGPHPATRDFNLITVFPFARQIGINDRNKEWNSVSLVDVAQRGWVETGKLEGNIAFDKARDIPGPVSIAAALTRNVNDREQRVAVIGSGSFLANSFLGNGGNLDFGVNLINWLSGDERLVTVQPRATVDGNLTLSRTASFIIIVCFLFALPLGLALAGGIIWWRRRRL